VDRKTFSISGAAFFGAFAAVICLATLHGCSRNGDLLALVNGQPITLKDFSIFLANKPRALVVTENGKSDLPVSGTLGGQAAVEIVKQELELQLAREKGLFPTEAELEHEVDVRKRQNPTFLLDLEAQGVTLDVIRKSIQISLAEEKLVTQGVKVTTEQAKAYIHSHPSEFLNPARVKLAFILVRSEDAEKPVDEALAAGQSFTDVALKYSQASTAAAYNGGLTDPSTDLPAITSLADIVQGAIAGLDLYGSSIWVPFGNGFARFYVEKLVKAQPMKIDADKLESVRRALARRKGEQVNDLNAMLKQKIAQSTIKILPDEYKNAMDEDANAP